MRAIPKTAVDFVALHEGVKLKAYKDSAGIPTLGVGHIEGVKMGDTCTKAQAMAWLAEDMKIAQRKLYGVLKPDVIDSLTANQWSALLSFVFNVGAGAKWTIWKRLNARQYDTVPGELIKFVNAGGRKVQGLVNRRADEVKLWSTDEPGSTDRIVPSSVTREIDTPPTPADPIPAHKSATLMTGALGVMATVPVAAKQVTDAVEPYKDASPWIGQVVALVATIAAAAAVVVLVLNWMAKRQARS